jgi:SAM-dependent methyltransferase
MTDENQGTSILYNDPNRYARPASLDIQQDAITIHGYQEFVVRKHSLSVLDEDQSLRRKRELLYGYLKPRFLSQRSLLDLGANSGFFSFWAIQQGSSKVTALDTDEKYLEILETAKSHLLFSNLDIVNVNVSDWKEPADNVLALALIHWVYSCTSLFGSLDSVIRRFAEISKYMLIVEWIDPSDPAIQFFHHLDWNKNSTDSPYSFEAFEQALQKYFVRYQKIGDVSSTRSLYVAFHSEHEIDFSCPLHLIKPMNTMISGRLLTSYLDVDYWSMIYDIDNKIYKQATLDLAEREGRFLEKFDSPYFPKVTEIASYGNYSVITLEKIAGRPLNSEISNICSSINSFYDFTQHCVNILVELSEKGIVHRDIRNENILVRDGKPVLMDFGWAISGISNYITPPGLGASERPPDGSFCNVYSMGKVLEQVLQHRYPAFDLVISLMTTADTSSRINDLNILKRLFSVVKHMALEGYQN